MDLTSFVTSAVTNAPLGFALLAPDGRFLWVNDWLATVSGIDHDAVEGHGTSELFGQTDPLLAEHFVHVVRTGEAVTGIELAVVVGGERRIGNGSFVPVTDETGAVAAVATIWWGIADPGPAEQARRELEGRFRTLADAAPVLIWMADTDGACDWFNAGWLEFTGRTMEESLGDRWTEVLHPDDAGRVAATYRDAIDRRDRFEVEYRVRRHDGVHRWVLDWAVPRFTPDGTFAGYIGSCIDIEDRRAAEAAERAARHAAEQTADRLGRLQAVTSAFAETHTPEGVFEVVVAEAVAASGADAGSVSLLAPDGETIDVVRSVGYRDELVGQYARFPLAADLPIAEAIRTGEPVYLELHAAVPLVVWGRTTGALGLSFETSQPFDDDQRAFLAALARQCATALERARLFESESAARQAAEAAHVRLMFLAEASEVIASTLDRTEVLRRVVELAVPRLADHAAAYLPDGACLQRIALAPAGPDLPPIVGAPTVGIDDDTPVAACRRRGAHRTDGGIAVPITARGVTLGVLAFARDDAVDDDLAVAVELGARVGVALENAGLYEREHTMAEALQRAVLPARLPDVDGVALAARYIPASPGMEVGGDWYDAFPLRDGRLGIAVGDVAGHGLRAAATMGQLRNALRAYAVDGDPPAVVLARLGALLRDEGEEAFATAVYATLDPATGCVRWANAGHPPALRVGADATFLDDPVGTVLGSALSDGEEGELSLGPGEALLFVTDGLIERRGEHLSEGMGRLQAAVRRRLDAPVEALCDAVVAEVLGEDARNDDVCLLAVRRQP
jgi:PAS domain S-box-containing protein